MSAVRVLYLITDLSTGGAQVALSRLLARLDRQRFEPTVACFFNGDSDLAGRIRSLDIPVFDLGLHGWRAPAGFLRLARLIRRLRPSILHAWMFHANFGGRLVGRPLGVPVVITSRRNTDIGGAWRERLNRWTSGLDDAVIAVCKSARRLEIERAGIPPDKVVTIYNGLEASAFDPYSDVERQRVRTSFGISEENFLIGAISRLHPQKGLDCLVAALAQLAPEFPQARLLLVGGGGLRLPLQQQAAQLGLGERVIFAGELRDSARLLPALNAYALPSLWEGLSNALLEALAAGLPVVATAVGGTPEVVQDGESALLVPPGDPSALAAALQRLLQDSSLRLRLGRAGQEVARTRFSIQTTVRQTEAFYELLLSRKANRP